MFESLYDKLTVREREEFVRTANLLLSRNFIIRDVYSQSDKAVRINYDYRFAERHFEMLREYFEYSGWVLDRDNSYGVISLANSFEHNRERLDKFTTITLFIIRLIYEEARENLSLKREVVTNVSDVVTKMINLGISDRKPPDRDIAGALRTLRKYNIIEKLEGDYTDPDTRLIIYPSILFIVTNEKISSLYKMAGIEEDLDEQTEEEEEADRE